MDDAHNLDPSFTPVEFFLNEDSLQIIEFTVVSPACGNFPSFIDF